MKENRHLQAVNDIDSDDLDEEEEQKFPAKKRKLSKKEQEKLKAKEKAKAKRGKKKGGDDSDFEDDSDDDEYSALSRRAISNRDKGNASVKPPVGSFDTCAECEKQFTVVRSGSSHYYFLKCLFIVYFRLATLLLQILVLAGCAMSALKALA